MAITVPAGIVVMQMGSSTSYKYWSSVWTWVRLITMLTPGPRTFSSPVLLSIITSCMKGGVYLCRHPNYDPKPYMLLCSCEWWGVKAISVFHTSPSSTS